jgi:hypothetical protein
MSLPFSGQAKKLSPKTARRGGFTGRGFSAQTSGIDRRILCNRRGSPAIALVSKVRPCVPCHQEAAQYRQPLQNSIQHVDTAKQGNHKGREEREGRVRSETSRFSRVISEFLVIFPSFVVEILFEFL